MATYRVKLITPINTYEIDCPDDTYILDITEEESIELPYSCRAILAPVAIIETHKEEQYEFDVGIARIFLAKNLRKKSRGGKRT